jgi:hypothetical protein
VTEALLALYRETRQGQKASDALQRLLERPEVQEDGERAARLHQLRAQILRDEVKDEAGAAAELEQALDRNPRLVQAFGELEEMLSRGRRWPELEQAYLRMIQRLPKGPEAGPARLALWKTLGELYRRVLDDPDRARTAYEVVVKADPDDASALEIHAELCGRAPGREAEAVEGWRRLVRIGGAPGKAASALVKLHAARKEFDQAYTAAQVVAFLTGGATPEERQVVERLKRFAREAASTALDDKAWRERLLHERLRGPLAEVMALLAREAGPLFAHQPKELGLDPKKGEVDVGGSMLFFVNMFKYVARTLGLPTPRLFRVEGPAGRLSLVPTAPPALVAAEDLFRERPKKELWFTIGRAMAFSRPELTLARLMPHDQLEAVFQAACSLGTSRFVVTADPQTVEKVKRQLAKVLPPATQTQSLKLLARRYCEAQQAGDVRGYMDACELTANRVGALVSGDLEVARKGLAEKAQVSKLRDETRLRDLTQFCLSEDWTALRSHLGLSVVVQG